jgi:hypothetical protein
MDERAMCNNSTNPEELRANYQLFRPEIPKRLSFQGSSFCYIQGFKDSLKRFGIDNRWFERRRLIRRPKGCDRME